MEQISYVGMDVLEEMEQDTVKEIVSKEFEKIERLVKQKISLVVHIKSYEKDGNARKYLIHLRVDYPNVGFSSESVDWDLPTALHKVVDNVKNEVKHKLRLVD